MSWSTEEIYKLLPEILWLRDLERGIAEGVSPSPNFEDGLRTQAMLDAARESSANGRVVGLAEVAGG